MAEIVPNNAIATETTSFVLQGRHFPSVDIDFKEKPVVRLHYTKVGFCSGADISLWQSPPCDRQYSYKELCYKCS